MSFHTFPCGGGIKRAPPPLPDPHDICRSARLRQWLRSQVCGPLCSPLRLSGHDTGRASNACRLISAPSFDAGKLAFLLSSLQPYWP